MKKRVANISDLFIKTMTSQKHVAIPFSRWKTEPDPQAAGHWRIAIEGRNTVLVYGMTRKDAEFIVNKHNRTKNAPNQPQNVQRRALSLIAG